MLFFLLGCGFPPYLEFCADAVGSRHQDGIRVSSCLQVKEASKASELCIAACKNSPALPPGASPAVPPQILSKVCQHNFALSPGNFSLPFSTSSLLICSGWICLFNFSLSLKIPKFVTEQSVIPVTNRFLPCTDFSESQEELG